MSILGSFNSLSARGMGWGVGIASFDGTFFISSPRAAAMDSNAETIGVYNWYPTTTSNTAGAYKIFGGVWQPTTITPSGASQPTSISGDGNTYISVDGAPDLQIYRWYGSQWALDQTITGVGGFDKVSKISRDASTIASMTSSGTVRVYRLNTVTNQYALISTFTGPADYQSLAISADGNVIVTGGNYSTAGIQGVVYIDRWNGTTYVRDITIPDSTISNDVHPPNSYVVDVRFGTSVAINDPGNVVVVGCPGADGWSFMVQGSVVTAGQLNVSLTAGYITNTNTNTTTNQSDITLVFAGVQYYVLNQISGTPGGVGIYSVKTTGGTDIPPGAYNGTAYTSRQGRAYVYSYNGAAWALDTSLVPPQPTGPAPNKYGIVAINGAGDKIFVSRQWRGTSTAAFECVWSDVCPIYEYSKTTSWALTQEIVPPLVNGYLYQLTNQLDNIACSQSGNKLLVSVRYPPNGGLYLLNV